MPIPSPLEVLSPSPQQGTRFAAAKALSERLIVTSSLDSGKPMQPPSHEVGLTFVSKLGTGSITHNVGAKMTRMECSLRQKYGSFSGSVSAVPSEVAVAAKGCLPPLVKNATVSTGLGRLRLSASGSVNDVDLTRSFVFSSAFSVSEQIGLSAACSLYPKVAFHGASCTVTMGQMVVEGQFPHLLAASYGVSDELTCAASIRRVASEQGSVLVGQAGVLYKPEDGIATVKSIIDTTGDLATTLSVTPFPASTMQVSLRGSVKSGQVVPAVSFAMNL